MRKGFGVDKLNNVLSVFPELNREWLLYGEGEMLKAEKNISQIGDIRNNGGNTTIATKGSTANNHSSAVEKCLAEIAEQRKLTAQAQDMATMAQSMTLKAQEQTDRLLTLLEKK